VRLGAAFAGHWLLNLGAIKETHASRYALWVCVGCLACER
jgi:hypothetical protein